MNHSERSDKENSRACMHGPPSSFPFYGLTLYNVCAVPWGGGGVQYRGGDILSSVGVLSTVGGYHEYREGLS